MKVASFVAPKMVTNMAYNFITNPQIQKARENEQKTLEKAEKAIFPFGEYNIQTYQWKNNTQNNNEIDNKNSNKKILLIHGWEGQAGNFSDIVERLLQENYTVFAFDAPSHGLSSKGKTHPFQFAEVVGIMIRKFEVNMLISHSFGGVATTLALSNNLDIEIEKYILLTTPNRFSERINSVAEQVGISKNVKKRLIKQLNDDAKIDINTLNVCDFVQKIKVKNALIIHDKNDKILPIEYSRVVQSYWKNAILEEIEGTGHFKILREKKVMDRIVLFLEQ